MKAQNESMNSSAPVRRRDFLATGLAAAASASAAQSAAGSPNIVYFMVDQLAARWLWDDASKAISTPNFDALRARGVAFTNTISSNPICCPTRATLATGLTTRGHGVLQNGYELDPRIPTAARLLQQGGWRTGAFGKLHYRSHFHGLHPDYTPYGFDVVWNTEDGRGGPWLDWVQQEHPEYFDAALSTITAFQIPEFQAYGPQKLNLSKRIEEVRSTFKYATPQYPHNTRGRFSLPFPSEVSQTEWITRHAIQFMEETAANKPVHAFISYVQPHSPFCPPGEYLGRVDVSKIPAPNPIEWMKDPLAPKCFPHTEGARVKIPEEWRFTRQYYLADVMHLDAQLGRVVASLEKSGRLSNTYLIFLSDHGELLHDHGFTGKGERHYESCVRVPLVIAGPGVNRGKTCNEFAQLEDVFPTVLDMAHIAPPRPRADSPSLQMPEGAEAYPGKSLMPICRGDALGKWRDQAYIESYNNTTSTTTDFWARSIRTRDYRYSLYPGGTGEQMFALREDPAEQHNLAGDPAYANVRREMRDRLLEQVIAQDYPHTPRGLYSLGVH